MNINGHLNSIEAVRAAWALRTSMVIPLHYGAYGYLFVNELKKPWGHDEIERLLGSMYKPLVLGESMPLPKLR
jgi:L-ascorbate metabolism protein UlaG (beta-lactamase superfamily)